MRVSIKKGNISLNFVVCMRCEGYPNSSTFIWMRRHIHVLWMVAPRGVDGGRIVNRPTSDRTNRMGTTASTIGERVSGPSACVNFGSNICHNKRESYGV